MSKVTAISTAENHAQSQNHSELIDAVAEDRKLGPDEKETLLRFAKSEDRVWVYTEERGLMRRLLQHPEFRLESLRVVTEESCGERVDPDDFSEGSITGVDGWVPISVLSLKTSSRSTSQHAAIVPDRVLREG
ncbi:hypothetical protein [Haloarcula sp. K1]|uniref:hypothetical protein n=1 Tax=Haloarcula sp. K1 TaxID=1622207 RepID=UPI0007BAE18F|nr:hypothetical protein [Haloarcula sp. K1]KZX49198.1 hypothetical protein AV929_11665 [Haloarcula sp. K1]